MRIVHILHHSISPFAGQYPEGDPLRYNSGLSMKYARAVRARYPNADIECWRPERVARQVHIWRDETVQITHRIFPSLYARYNLEYSRTMVRMLHDEVDQGETYFLMQGSYNLHTYLLAPVLSMAPTILQSHGGFPAYISFRRSSRSWRRLFYLAFATLERMTLPRYRHIFAISQEERTYLAELCPNSKVHFSPTGISFDTFSTGNRRSARAACGLAENERVLLYVGRLSAEKGLEYLLEAFAIVLQRTDHPVRLLIAGSGPLRDSLMAQAQRLHLAQSVMFLGNIVSEALPQWYRAADVTVIPTPFEGFGVVAVESLACGTPIVGTKAGGLVDIVAEFECGLLVPPSDSRALAEAIVEALSRPSMPPPNIARGCAAFDWSVKIAHMMGLWESMKGNKDKKGHP